jgi:hypothetical protein
MVEYTESVSYARFQMGDVIPIPSVFLPHRPAKNHKIPVNGIDVVPCHAGSHGEYSFLVNINQAGAAGLEFGI